MSMKLKMMLAAALLMSSTGLSTSAEDPIAVRKAIMKNVGAAAGAGFAMVKGKAEFNAAAAELVLRTMNTAALGFGELFPAGSESGGKTIASQKIWDDRAGFNAALAKFAADSAAGIAAKPADLDAFKAVIGAAASNCNACHKAYRTK